MRLTTAALHLLLLQPAAAFVNSSNRRVLNKNLKTEIQHHDISPSKITKNISCGRHLLFMSSKTDSDEKTKTLDELASELNAAKDSAIAELGGCKKMQEAEDLRVKYLGKKGVVSQAMGYLRMLPNEDKPKLGATVNEVRDILEEKFREGKEVLKVQEIKDQMESEERIDVTMPGIIKNNYGRRHPLSMTMEKATDIFVSLGYDTVTDPEDSPEIETDYYCFEALNCPKDHPARDMQDTLYLTDDMERLLRTHTSAVQIRQMAKRKPPFRIVSPGRVYRRDDIDATHSMIFHQVEILAVEERGNLHLGHLKGTVTHFLKEMFGPSIDVRFRGSYFPFTEPSMEVDVFFKGKWLEVLGCGMVDPAVLEMAGIDPEKYSGFAAGFGAERFAMVIHQIQDIRGFYDSDVRFLEQFPHFHDMGGNRFLNPDQFVEVDAEEKKREAEKKAEMEKFDAQAWADIIADGGSVPKEIADGLKTKDGEKKKKKQAQAQPESTKIDVSKLDIRVGVITKAWEHEEAEKLFCEEIDIGEDEPRQIASGLRAHYKVDDLVGQRVLVLSNLKTRKLVGFPSHGMVMCAASADGTKVEFVEPPEGAAIGERVMIEGYGGEPATENQIIKKKMLEKIFPDLSTNEAGVATYKGVPFATSSGECVAQNKMPNSPVA
mmetsp:Transcript_25228/g.39046  ORF Transcript_25228/g.39046 Transcript_25228/m.39046 type:complete len:660 (-) Transcript_25228:121-2100(-)